MLMLRPVRFEDLDDLYTMAQTSRGGITSLPPDKRLLREKIERSTFAFSRDVLRPKGEAYLFVLEDIKKKRAVGCAGILSKTGGYEPLHYYHVHSEHSHSTHIEVTKQTKVLKLERVYNGPTEVGTLYLLPEYRAGGAGRMLSLCRFMFMGIHRNRFDDEVAALFRGVIEENTSPFWESICSHFYGIDFAEANRLRYADPRFMEELMPKYHLYIPLLPKEAQKVIGKTDPLTQPALHLLEKEGFTYSKLVDTFDAGPLYTAPLDSIGVVKRKKQAKVEHVLKSPPDAKEKIICNHSMEFRAIRAPVSISGGKATLSAAAAKALQVKRGDLISTIDAGKSH